MPSTRSARLAERARTNLRDRAATVDLAALATGTCLGGLAPRLAGASILVATRTQVASAMALVELDGLAARLTIAPPGLALDHLSAMMEDAAIDAIATDDPGRFASIDTFVVAIEGRIAPAIAPPRTYDTEWVMMTSGTSGRPKLVAHRLNALTGSIAGPPPNDPDPTWSTFYDIRRYGGLQIFLRALLGGTDLILSSEGEPLVEHMHRLGASGVSAISGTPSHWRRVLMSHDRGAFAPRYIRLSGEIADQMVLDGLRAAFPRAHIAHAYASTEAGVGFTIDDGLEGFPAGLIDEAPGGVTLRIVDGSLRIRSARAASRYLGDGAAPVTDGDGFVDTGDLVERRGARYVFVGRRGGIINVGGLKVNPEEVEAAINAHPAVRMSLVQARKSPLTGALVTAEIVLRETEEGSDVLKQAILETCRDRLDRHKVPVTIRFVPNLALTAGGKLSRARAS